MGKINLLVQKNTVGGTRLVQQPTRKNKSFSGAKTLSSNYKAVTGGAAFQNGVLNKIVDKLKEKFLDGEVHAVSIRELLQLTSQTEISDSVKEWLKTKALREEPRITIKSTGILGGTNPNYDNCLYIYNPPLNCSSKDTLLELLKQRDEVGPLGTLEDHIHSSVPHAERVLKLLENEGKIFSVVRSDKKKTYFYQGSKPDPKKELPQAYKTMFRNAFIYGYDDAKIEDDLNRNNIKSSGMCSVVLKKPSKPPRRRRTGTTEAKSWVHDNQHVEGLVTYDNLK